jgi:hypothetical protein
MKRTAHTSEDALKTALVVLWLCQEASQNGRVLDATERCMIIATLMAVIEALGLAESTMADLEMAKKVAIQVITDAVIPALASHLMQEAANRAAKGNSYG